LDLIIKVRTNGSHPRIPRWHLIKKQCYTQFYLLKIRHNPIKGVEISDVASLFSNIEDFRESHVRFASAFKAAVDSTEWPFINAGGALLAAVRVMQHWPSVDATRGCLSARRWSNDTPLVGWLFVRQLPKLLPAYQAYVENYKMAIFTLDWLTQENAKFNTYLEEAKNASKSKRDLRMLLNLPLEHLDHLENNVKAQVAFSMPGDYGHEELLKVEGILAQASSIMRTKLEQSSMMAKILSIERRLVSDVRAS